MLDPPGAPSAPEVTDSGNDFIRIQWKKPDNDGGNPISGYMVEAKESNSADWVPCNSFPTKATEFSANNVREGLSYEFRVIAVNDAGPGTPSRPSKLRKAEPPISKSFKSNKININDY